jgi:Tol biopolymer transport system component
MKFFFKPPTPQKIIILLFACSFPALSFGQESNLQDKPLVDSTAKVMPFAPGIVDTHFDEQGSSFSPDGKTVYFAMGSVYSTICFSKNINGKWTKPQVASFSGKWGEMDASISPDGKKLFFSSTRPLVGAPQDKPNKLYELWYVDNVGNGNWSQPHHLGAPINTGNENNIAPCAGSDGTLYWSSWDRQPNKGMQTYYSASLGDHYTEAKLLSINGNTKIQDPFISANGKYLVFSDGQDIYIVMNNGDIWAKPQKLAAPVNNGEGAWSPYVSSDGKTLYFTSGRMQGFYKREPLKHALSFDELEKENDNIFNGSGNIFMVPVNLSEGQP